MTSIPHQVTEYRESDPLKAEKFENASRTNCQVCHVLSIIVVQGLLIIFFGIGFLYRISDETDVTENAMNIGNTLKSYNMFQDVSLLTLVGFAYLMIFPRFYRYTSLAQTFYAYVVGFETLSIMEGFWANSWHAHFEQIEMGPFYGLFMLSGCIALLITLGAILGKVDFSQMLFVSVFEMIMFALNEHIVLFSIKAKDQGGAMFIHTFGSTFGVFCTWVYSSRSNTPENPNAKASYGSITMTLFATLILWVLFPSYNACVGTDLLKFFSLMNSIMALTSCAATCFVISYILKESFLGTDHIINSTISVGIMIAASCDFYSGPVAPIAIGIFSGILSVCCYEFVAPLLEHCGLFDTCGTFHLHFVPGIFGGIISAIAAASINDESLNGATTIEEHFYGRSPTTQGGYQIAGLVICIAMGAGSGILAGLILRVWRIIFHVPSDSFGDHVYWKIEYARPAPLPQIIESIPPPKIVEVAISNPMI